VIAPVIPLNVDDISTAKTDTVKPSSDINAAFSAELNAAIKKYSTDKNKAEITKDDISSENGLKQLNNFKAANLNFSETEIKLSTQTLGATEREIADTLNNIRNDLMNDIKNSLLNLEKQVNDPDNKVPADLQKSFSDAITTIKNDFSSGFGVDFDSFQYEEKDQKENLLDKLLSFENSIPESLFTELDKVLA